MPGFSFPGFSIPRKPRSVSSTSKPKSRPKVNKQTLSRMSSLLSRFSTSNKSSSGSSSFSAIGSERRGTVFFDGQPSASSHANENHSKLLHHSRSLSLTEDDFLNSSSSGSLEDESLRIDSSSSSAVGLHPPPKKSSTSNSMSRSNSISDSSQSTDSKSTSRSDSKSDSSQLTESKSTSRSSSSSRLKKLGSGVKEVERFATAKSAVQFEKTPEEITEKWVDRGSLGTGVALGVFSSLKVFNKFAEFVSGGLGQGVAIAGVWLGTANTFLKARRAYSASRRVDKLENTLHWYQTNSSTVQRPQISSSSAPDSSNTNNTTTDTSTEIGTNTELNIEDFLEFAIKKNKARRDRVGKLAVADGIGTIGSLMFTLLIFGVVSNPVGWGVGMTLFTLAYAIKGREYLKSGKRRQEKRKNDTLGTERAHFAIKFAEKYFNQNTTVAEKKQMDQILDALGVENKYRNENNLESIIAKKLRS